MTKHINLTQGYTTLVDDEDYEQLSKYKWFAAVQKYGKVYAARSTPAIEWLFRPRLIPMHIELMGAAPKGHEVDHKNNDSLDNRRSNLRIATIAQNRQNSKKRSDNTTGYKGVNRAETDNRWLARIQNDGKTYYLGTYKTPIEAAQAYDEKARELHGEFARTNFP
jgi:hypothetical protein